MQWRGIGGAERNLVMTVVKHCSRWPILEWSRTAPTKYSLSAISELPTSEFFSVYWSSSIPTHSYLFLAYDALELHVRSVVFD